MKTRITYRECIEIYNIDNEFLESLEDLGLLSVYKEEDEKYIMYEELSNIEKYANWYYDLEINIAGIDIINRLLNKIDIIQEDKRLLNSQLSFYKQIDK